ncbi:lactonase family protein [Rhodohalobacter sp. 8-1]|uniref:lactonase family protein n=1 Tax=Rhodohalobacter sp. 8-1 TaxID=3131972 RepID=UPI0030EC4926
MKIVTCSNIEFLLINLVFGIVLTGCSQELQTANSNEFVYVGTFPDDENEGLHVFQFDRITGDMEEIQTISDREGPNFQAIHPDNNFLYSVSDDPFSDDEPFGTLSAYSIDADTGKLELLNEQSVQGRGTAHVSVDPLGEFVYVSNYSEGNVVVHRVNEDGSVSEALDIVQHEGSSINEQRQQRPHVHSAIPSPDGRFIYVSDLGIDQIKIYEIDRNTGEISAANMPFFQNEPGSGPRHFTIHKNGRFAYSVEELSVTVATLKVDPDDGSLEQVQRLSLLPEDTERDDSMSGADIHISPDGRFLYASVRGENLIAIYSINEENGELSLVGHESTVGSHPRNFMIDQKGDFLWVANRDNDHVVVFRRDQESGELNFTGIEVNVAKAVCVTQFIP